ncbi:MAG TPA: DUF6155 family protein [Crinalium sp.]|jgi:hypothetical protein
MVKNNIGITALKQHLNNASKEELIKDITELFKRFGSVKDYYQAKLNPEEDSQVIEKYKKIIENEFFPSRGLGKAQLSVARKAVSDYKKVCTAPEKMADIMLFYVEQGVRFTDAYGDIDERFYNSMESMYQKAVEWIVKYELKDVFQSRCQRIVQNTSMVGWGFHDVLSEIYHEAFRN